MTVDLYEFVRVLAKDSESIEWVQREGVPLNAFLVITCFPGIPEALKKAIEAEGFADADPVLVIFQPHDSTPASESES